MFFFTRLEEEVVTVHNCFSFICSLLIKSRQRVYAAVVFLESVRLFGKSIVMETMKQFTKTKSKIFRHIVIHSFNLHF